MKQDSWTVDTSCPRRLDQLLTDRYPNYSRTYFQRLIKGKQILMNGAVAKSRFIPQQGDRIEVTFTPRSPLRAEPQDLPLHLLFEDEHIIALNKPPNQVVHPAPGHLYGTIANAVAGRYHNFLDPLRPGIIHRLDRETSGLLLVAKNDASLDKFSKLFAERRIEKTYLAVTWGNPGERCIDLPIGRHPRNRQLMAVRADGKRAITEIRPLRTIGELSLLEIRIKTGRTHQIRAHLRHINTPLIGDPLYGFERINKQYGIKRQLLHAHTLSFVHPYTGQMVNLQAPLPDDMAAFIQHHLRSH